MAGVRLACLPLIIAAFTPLPVLAGTVVYQCTHAGKAISYQDTPCAVDEHQRVQRLSSDVPAPAASVPVPAPPAPASVPKPAPPVAATALARSPPPVLYRCVRATDGSTYLSGNPHPRPYLAPLGMLGIIQQPLAEVYGSEQGAGVGMSAPELANKPTPALIGGYLTWVRDACRRLSPRAACAALRKHYEANQEAIRNAFRSDRGPLLAKGETLRAQMAGCRNAPRG